MMIIITIIIVVIVMNFALEFTLYFNEVDRWVRIISGYSGHFFGYCLLYSILEQF